MEKETFTKNIAGPALDISIDMTASQIYIKGGMNVKIKDCTF